MRISSAQSTGIGLNILRTKNGFVKDRGKTVGQDQNSALLLTVCNPWLEGYFPAGAQRTPTAPPAQRERQAPFGLQTAVCFGSLGSSTPGSAFQAVVGLPVNPP